MSDIPREQLIALVSQFGPTLHEDAQRCRNLLRDFCGDYKRETNALVSAISERIVADLKTSRSTMPVQLQIDRCVQRLHANLGIMPELARWSVETWAIALGIIEISEISTSTVCNSQVKAEISNGTICDRFERSEVLLSKGDATKAFDEIRSLKRGSLSKKQLEIFAKLEQIVISEQEIVRLVRAFKENDGTSAAEICHLRVKVSNYLKLNPKHEKMIKLKDDLTVRLHRTNAAELMNLPDNYKSQLPKSIRDKLFNRRSSDVTPCPHCFGNARGNSQGCRYCGGVSTTPGNASLNVTGRIVVV